MAEPSRGRQLLGSILVALTIVAVAVVLVLARLGPNTQEDSGRGGDRDRTEDRREDSGRGRGRGGDRGEARRDEDGR